MSCDRGKHIALIANVLDLLQLDHVDFLEHFQRKDFVTIFWFLCVLEPA